MNKDITILVGHPDDEFLFGFPVIHRAKKIIACVDDKTHPTRQWCNRRAEAFADVCKMVGAEGVCLRHDSGFIKKEHKDLVAFVAEVRRHLEGAETIFTHNAWGEYGHTDHILLHQIVRMTDARMLTTDIVLQADWYPIIPKYSGRHIAHVQNDLVFHEKCMEIYRSYKAMGWPYPPVKDCMLVEVER